MSEPEFINIPEWGRRLGVSKDSAYKAARLGQIPGCFAIGRLYRRQDEIGTAYCVTVDVQTVGDSGKGEHGDGRVTIRDRDSMEQVRVPIPALVPVLKDLLEGGDWTAVAGRFGGVPATPA